MQHYTVMAYDSRNTARPIEFQAENAEDARDKAHYIAISTHGAWNGKYSISAGDCISGLPGVPFEEYENGELVAWSQEALR
jgi:hypothetical protein